MVFLLLVCSYLNTYIRRNSWLHEGFYHVPAKKASLDIALFLIKIEKRGS